MPNLNRVFLMGNLTRDPELRYLPSNMPVVALGLAINRRWRNQQGEMQEDTTFVDCDAFGKTAETINQYLRKGRPIFIEGRLRLDSWQDKEGQNRSKLKVVVERFEFVDSRGGGGEEGGGGGEGGPSGASASPRGNYNSRGAARPAGQAGGYNAPRNAAPPTDPHQPVEEDDIPF